MKRVVAERVFTVSIQRLTALVFGLLSAVVLQAADTIHLAWDPSPDTNVIGYVLYYGDVDGSSLKRVEVGNATSASISDFQSGISYFIYTKALSDTGVESVPSNVLNYSTTPEVLGTPPQVTSNPVNLTVMEDDPVLLQVSATGSAPLVYQWKQNGQDLPGANSSSWSIEHASVADSGSYSVSVQNPAGSALSAAATLLVLPNSAPNTPPSITPIPNVSLLWNETASVTFAIGDSESPIDALRVGAEASDTNLLDASSLHFLAVGPNYSLTISPKPGHAGFVMLTVRVTDSHGGSATSEFGVLISEPPVALGLTMQTNLVTQQNVPTSVEKIQLITSESNADDIILLAESLDPQLIPPENILFGGSGTERFVIIVPGLDKLGSTTLTIRATDGIESASQQVQVTIVPPQSPPVVNAPSLRVERSSSNLIVAWPNTSGIYLETASDLANGWKRSDALASVVGNELQVTVQLDKDQHFFRMTTGSGDSASPTRSE